MSSNVGSVSNTPIAGAFQYNPYANDYFDDLDMNFNSYSSMTGGSIFDGYSGMGMGMMPVGTNGNNQSYFNNMKDYQKFYIDYNVDQQNMQRNADLRINASLEGIKGAAAVLQDKIKQNEQDQIPQAFQAYLNSVSAAYGEGTEKELKARALTLYQNMTGKSLIQDLRDNGHSSFVQGMLQSALFSTAYRTSAEDNISQITGQPVGTTDKAEHAAGRLAGAGVVGLAAGGIAKSIAKGATAGSKLSKLGGKTGTIIGLAAGAITAALSFITGGKSA